MHEPTAFGAAQYAFSPIGSQYSILIRLCERFAEGALVIGFPKGSAKLVCFAMASVSKPALAKGTGVDTFADLDQQRTDIVVTGLRDAPYGSLSGTPCFLCAGAMTTNPEVFVKRR